MGVDRFGYNSRKMRPFSLLIKPAGADCNLRCRYCFYLGRGSLYPETSVHRMQDATLERLVRGYLALPLPVHTFAFQGGEPLLMGEAFYVKLLQLQRRYARPGAVITNCVQTNGTLLTPELATLFAREHFLLGVSVDGEESVHNHYRRTVSGGGSHAEVLRGLELLKQAGAEFNLLTLVNKHNVRDPVGLYTYLRDTLHCTFMQFIECVEFDAHGALAPYSITPEEWADFVIALFDAWFPNDRTRVSIRFFDSVVNTLLSGNPNSCAMGTCCQDYVVVEHTGDVYPCDFFVRPELRLGNILEQDWDEILENPIRKAFGARKSAWNAECEQCPYLMFCHGDCPKNRAGHNPEADSRTLSALCPAWKRIYAHILPPLRQAVKALEREQRGKARNGEGSTRPR